MHIVLTYAVRPEERAEARRWVRGRRPSLWWVVAVFTVLGSLAQLTPPAVGSGRMLLITAGVYAVLLTGGALRERLRSRDGEVRAELTMQGATFRSVGAPPGRYRMRSGRITAVEETENLVLLRHFGRKAFILPKRAFTGPELETFRNVVRGPVAGSAPQG